MSSTTKLSPLGRFLQWGAQIAPVIASTIGQPPNPLVKNSIIDLLPKADCFTRFVAIFPLNTLSVLQSFNRSCSQMLTSFLPFFSFFFFFFLFEVLNEFYLVYSCTMIITMQFYSISIPNRQHIPPPPTCLLWKPNVYLKEAHNELLCRTDTDSQTLKNLWLPTFIFFPNLATRHHFNAFITSTFYCSKFKTLGHRTYC